jgi:hypothetical protein
VRFSQLIRQYGMPVMTVHAPCLVNHEGVVCCGDRKGFSGASLCTAISPLHCTGYQILRPHFQTCGPNIEKIVEENFAQRIKVLRPAVCDECVFKPPAGHVRGGELVHRVEAVQKLALEAVPLEGRRKTK